MSWLTKIALKKRWLTFIIVALVTGVSIWATITLKQELIPDIELPVTSVIAIYPQASPEEVMNEVTVPVESAISGTAGLRHFMSTSAEGMCSIFARFAFGTDMDEVNSAIRQNLSQLTLPPAVRDLPSKMPQLEENPRLFAINIDMMPVVMMNLIGDLPLDELQDIATTAIIPRLEAIEGVYHVTLEGGTKDNLLVTPDPEKMNQSGISMSRIAGILAAQEYNSISEVENAAMGADTVVLKDIAEVKLGPPPGTALSRTNGKPSVSIMVSKDSEANIVEVANAVAAEAGKIRETLGDGIELLTVLDQSEFIERSISDLTRNAIIGFVLASIVVFLFLMAFRASLVTVISIPLSIVIGFLAMRGLGITINILTLSAMAIVVGRVIDNSIVVLEVIYRRMQEGEAFKEATLSGVSEVAAPITSATLATIVIFIPLALVGGMVGVLFIPFALTITFALVASLLVALTIVPALSNFSVSGKARTRTGGTWYQRLYTPMLKWSLSHRAAAVAITVVLFFGSLILIPIIGTSFIPEMAEKMLTVEIETPPGTDLATIEEVAIQAEEVLGGNPQVKTYQTTIGTSTSLFGSFSTMGGGGISTASIMVILDRNADLEQEAAELRKAYQGIAEKGAITVISGQAMAAQMTGAGLEISVLGDDFDDIADAAERLVTEIAGVDGLVNIEAERISVKPKLNIEPDPAKLMTSGLPMEQLSGLQQEFYLLIRGGTVAQANTGGKTYDVFLEGIVQDLDDIETANQLMIGYPTSVALGDIATVELTEQPTSIQRIDRKLATSISADITARNIGAVNRAVQEKIDALALPPGVEVKAGGVTEEMRETFSGMFIAIIAAILLAYAVLVVSFRSFLNPFIIMVSLPLASIGALLGLLITGYPVGASALMGMLMLVGIALTNAIVLITLVDQLRKRGMSIYDALVEAGQTRLRPILMTALTTMLAMLPLALGLGEGVLMAAELAVVVIGGLFSSTFLTLLVIPVIYSLLAGLRRASAGK